MAFPVDAARIASSAFSTNKVCNLPSGIVSGHLLVLILRSAASDTHSTPNGWTALVLNNSADASDDVTSIWYRIADGLEGSTVTVSCTAETWFAAICWRITGARTPELSTTATGLSATPDPPSFTPSGGASDYLWLWLGGWEGTGTSPPSGNPTNYSNPVGASGSTVVKVAGASRQLGAASENPPSWTITSADDWSAWTLAVPSLVVNASAQLSGTATITANARSVVFASAALQATAQLSANARSLARVQAALVGTATLRIGFIAASAALIGTATIAAKAQVQWRNAPRPVGAARAKAPLRPGSARHK